MSSVSSFRRFLNALTRLRPRLDRTRTTSYAMDSNQTAIRNLRRAIEKQRDPGRERTSIVRQCLARSFELPPAGETSAALQAAVEKLRAAPTEEPRTSRPARGLLRHLRLCRTKRRDGS